MAFTSEDVKVKEGSAEKTYTITDESKAAELAVIQEQTRAILELARAVRRG